MHGWFWHLAQNEQKSIFSKDRKGTWVLTEFSFLLTVVKKRQESGDRNCFSGFFFPVRLFFDASNYHS